MAVTPDEVFAIPEERMSQLEKVIDHALLETGKVNKDETIVIWLDKLEMNSREKAAVSSLYSGAGWSIKYETTHGQPGAGQSDGLKVTFKRKGLKFGAETGD